MVHPSTDSTEQRLLEAVWADPQDDEARLVYADWLIERGDPRGELIALQCSPATPVTQQRTTELISRYGQQWLASYVRGVNIGLSGTFERGFLHTLEWNADPTKLLRIAGPWLSTVETLVVRWWGRKPSKLAVKALSSPHLGGLLRLVGPSLTSVAQLATGRKTPHQLNAISAYAEDIDEVERSIASLAGLPRLKTLLVKSDLVPEKPVLERFFDAVAPLELSVIGAGLPPSEAPRGVLDPRPRVPLSVFAHPAARAASSLWFGLHDLRLHFQREGPSFRRLDIHAVQYQFLRYHLSEVPTGGVTRVRFVGSRLWATDGRWGRAALREAAACLKKHFGSAKVTTAVEVLPFSPLAPGIRA
jgi:uncharacterized protein (TIGR02996 family)